MILKKRDTLGSVSIKDIAQKANVSPSTVSRALRDHPRISTETKNHIQELAQEMGYIPSEVARSLVGQRSATIGVAIADFLDPFYTSLCPEFIIKLDADQAPVSIYVEQAIRREKPLYRL